MSLLPPSLLQRLSRSKLRPRRAVASTGVGERRSKAKGVGMEFADHRPYQMGDDIRYLDRHIFARLGENHIKQFSLYQQLQVTILLDVSASMRFGEQSKFACAKALAAGLAYVALTGGDRVQIGAFSSDKLEWSSPFHGVQRVPALFHWLDNLEPGRTTNLSKTTRQAIEKMRSESLVVIISDWLTTDIETALTTLDLKRQELVAVQILAPEEEEPERLGSGEIRMVDTETGQEIELSLDAALLERYREHLENWSRSVRDTVREHRGLFLRVRSDADLGQIFLKDWRKAGLIV
jgi:uncharacterized protein (DUF58 family)